jgi:hypothetical protein
MIHHLAVYWRQTVCFDKGEDFQSNISQKAQQMSEAGQMTLIVEATCEKRSLSRQISRIWLDDKEMMTAGLTLPELFSHLEQLGWKLSLTRAIPGKCVNRVVYFYSKPRPSDLQAGAHSSSRPRCTRGHIASDAVGELSSRSSL